jgi:hypothetical protein
MNIVRALAVFGLLAVSVPAFAADPPPPPAQPAAAQPDARLELARRVLKDNGAADAMLTTIDGAIEKGIIDQKAAHPEISDAFWNEFRIELRAYLSAHTGDLIDIIAQSYADHMTLEELQQTVVFYETGPGKKLIDPALAEEVKTRSGAWGESVGAQLATQVLEKLKETGQQ